MTPYTEIRVPLLATYNTEIEMTGLTVTVYNLHNWMTIYPLPLIECLINRLFTLNIPYLYLYEESPMGYLDYFAIIL